MGVLWRKGSVTLLLLHFPNTVVCSWDQEEKQKQGTQLSHPSKTAGGREDLEDEKDGFGKPPTVKPFPPAQLLLIKISANEKKPKKPQNQLVSKTFQEHIKL